MATRSTLPPEAWFTVFDWAVRWAAEEFLTGIPGRYSVERENRRAMLMRGTSAAFSRDGASMGRVLARGAVALRTGEDA